MDGYLTLELLDDYSLGKSRREEVRQLLASCFPDGEYRRTRTYLKQVPQRRLLATLGSSVVGHVGLEYRAVGTSLGPFRIFGLVDVCVDARKRRQGIASRMLNQIECLAKTHDIPFLVLFAKDPRLYERNGYVRASNPLRWMKVHEHRTFGIAEEPLQELMVKAIGDSAWPSGTIDLLGHQF